MLPEEQTGCPIAEATRHRSVLKCVGNSAKRCYELDTTFPTSRTCVDVVLATDAASI